MTTFELRTLEILVFGSIATAVIGCVIEKLFTLHGSNIIAIQKRSDDFIKLSKEYYIPFANLAAEISSETDPYYNKVRPKVFLFRMAKYSSFIKKFTNENVRFIFPKQTQELKVNGCADTLHDAINSLIFNDDKEDIEGLIKYYDDKKQDFIPFIEEIDTLPKYKKYEVICKNDDVIKELYRYSTELEDSITNGIAEEYKIWHKHEFLKKLTKRNIKNNEDNGKRLIKELRDKIDKQNEVINTDKIPHFR